MPAISGIRITNVKYNKQQKVYDDLIFDMKDDEKPLHSLISFVNSGGKGVLLQSLFQVLLPETEWGSENENKVKHFFYNTKGQPAPYTIYIAIEWHLDDRSENALITGIAISGESIKNDIKQMDINYSLFTYVTNSLSAYRLDTLPYYSEDGKLKSLSAWEAFLDSHNTFRKFTKSTKNKYYKHLREEYGIYKDDWLAMKEMNRREAGITDYFQKSNTTTNYGLFYYLIIPAIIENIENSIEAREKKDLVSLFKEMALIAKNLPILNQREEAFADLSEVNEKITDALKEVKQTRVKLSQSLYDGNVLYHLMDHMVNEMEQQLQEWEAELERLIERQKEYHWQEVNLEFNEVHFKALELNEQKNIVDGRIANNKKEQTQYNDEIKNFETGILLKQYKEANEKEEFTRSQIDQIESRTEFKDVTNRLSDLSGEIADEWKEVYPAINDRIYAFQEKIKEIQFGRKLIVDDRDKWLKQKADSSARANHLNELIEKYHEKEEALLKDFPDPRFKTAPKSVLDTFNDEFVELENTLEKMKKEIELNKLEKNSLEIKRGVLSGTVEELKEKRDSAKKTFQQYQANEKEIIEQTFRFVGSDADFNPSLDWLRQQQGLLKKQLKRLEDRIIPDLQQEFWKMQTEGQHATEDFWIPNHEVAELKRVIEDQGIQVLFGTDYLSNFEQDVDRKEKDQLFPLLKYGLIIYERDVNTVHEIIDLTLKVMHAPVPIYVAERLNEKETIHYELLNNHSTVLATITEEWKRRKESIGEEIERFKASIDGQKEKKEQLWTLLNQIEDCLKYTSEDIQKQVNKINAEIEQKQEEIDKFYEEISIFERDIDRLEKKEAEGEDTLKKKENLITTLENWITEGEEHKRNVEAHKEMVAKQKEAEQNYNLAQTKLTNIDNQLDEWRNSYNKWEYKLEDKLSKFQIFAVNTNIPTGEKVLLEHEEPTYSEDFMMFSKVDVLYNEWNHLQSELNTLNAELNTLKERIKHERNAVKKLEDSLMGLDKDWRMRSISIEPISVLEQKKSELVAAEKEIRKALKTDEEECIGLTKALEHNDQDKEKIKKKYKKLESDKFIEIWDDIDLREKEQEIAMTLHEVKKELIDTNGFIQDLTLKIKDYKGYAKRVSENIDSQMEVTHIPKRLENQLYTNAEAAITAWLDELRDVSQSYQDRERSLISTFQTQKRLMGEKDWDIHLKEDVISTYDSINITDIEEIEGVINNVNEYILNERNTMKVEKDKGEKAKEDWVTNASQLVLTIVEALKRMKLSMTIINKGSYKFPLIDFADYKLPKRVEDVREPLNEFFEKKIKEALNTFDDIEQVKPYELKKIINNSKIAHEALGQFPELKIYNFNTDNTFIEDRKRPEYYTTWETINLSSETEAAGSGGQKVAARMLIAMMILNYKRQLHMKGQWNVMISDNPFSNAVSVHVVDPIIAVADALKIQWLVVAPPETLKAEVTVKFPLYVPLDFKRSATGKDVVVQEVKKTFRKRTEQTTLF